MAAKVTAMNDEMDDRSKLEIIIIRNYPKIDK